MKKLLQKLIMKLYWKLGCHTIEPFAHQLVLYAIPKPLREKDIVTIMYAFKNNINNQRTELVEICYAKLPEKEVFEFDNIDEILKEWKL